MENGRQYTSFADNRPVNCDVYRIFPFCTYKTLVVQSMNKHSMFSNGIVDIVKGNSSGKGKKYSDHHLYSGKMKFSVEPDTRNCLMVVCRVRKVNRQHLDRSDKDFFSNWKCR